MYYVLCPDCDCPVEIPENAVGPQRTDPWNICRCDQCDVSFDYDDREVHYMDDEPGPQQD